MAYLLAKALPFGGAFAILAAVKAYCLLLLMCLLPGLLLAQPPRATDYYLFPIQPGQRGYLSGSMGEMRSTHFHGGIDIKTGGRIGLPVHAAAEGYVWRIRVSSYGYGKALYIKHPNGQFTVYGHLERFAPEIARYVLEQQYAQERFAVDLKLEPGQFPVRRGEVVAYSGNTGSSGGPHLHFEIRNEDEVPLNPLDFGFEEVKDRTRPFVQRLRVVPLEPDSRVEGRFAAQSQTATQRSPGQYRANTTAGQGWVGLQVRAFDRMDGTSNWYGIQKMVLYVNNQEHFRYQMDSISYLLREYIHVARDYAVRKRFRADYYNLYLKDGNQLPAYITGPERGRIYLAPGQSYAIRVELLDSFGNRSVLTTQLKGSQAPPTTQQPDWDAHYQVVDNTLQFYSQADTAVLHQRYATDSLRPSYAMGRYYTYLHDLRCGLPDSVTTERPAQPLAFVGAIPSGVGYKRFTPRLNLAFGQHALFDTLYLRLEHLGPQTFRLHHELVPLYEAITLTYYPDSLPADKSRLCVWRKQGRNLSYIGGEWVEGGKAIRFRTREFGTFTLAEDRTPPRLTVVQQNSGRFACRIFDESSGPDSGIRSFRATLDGQFLLMNYDHKRRYLWSERLDKSQPLQGLLELTITDRAGNVRTYRSQQR